MICSHHWHLWLTCKGPGNDSPFGATPGKANAVEANGKHHAESLRPQGFIEVETMIPRAVLMSLPVVGFVPDSTMCGRFSGTS